MLKNQSSSRGPVMAILVSNLTIQHLKKQIVNPRIKLLLEANKEVNLDYFYFSINRVRLPEGKIKGVCWNDRYNLWLPKDYTLPDVLYLRGGIPSRYRDRFEMFMEVLADNKTAIINYPRFNKWDLYLTISQDQVLKHHLPTTVAVNKPREIEKMLHQYDSVYLKSHLGRKGDFVLRVDKQDNEYYRYSYYKHSRNELVINTVYGLPALHDEVYKFFRGKAFVIQQAIDLLTIDGRLVDMRAELQRNRYGNLEIAGIAVRLGKPHSPITTHDAAYPLDYFFEHELHYPQERVDKIREKAEQFLFRVYDCIEKKYGEYVEIGIDFAIDANDKLWLIEANSQSTKNSLGKAYGRDVLLKAYRNILEYARYVAEKRN